MFLPLGLFLRLKTFPVITVLLACVCTIVHFVSNSYSEAQFELIKLEKNEEYGEVLLKIKKEYCETLHSEDVCILIPNSLNEKNKKRILIKEEADKKELLEKDSDTETKMPTESFYSQISSSLEKAQTFLEFEDHFNEIILEDSNSSSPLTKLVSFPDFEEKHTEFLNKKRNLIKENFLLTKKNYNIKSLFFAMFLHGNIYHLLGNMLALLVFGIHVEARVGSKYYFFSYFFGGALGLSLQVFTFNQPDLILLGASANVFCIMGMFYFVFKNFKMKFLVFYIIVTRVITLPIKYYFFALFILMEVILIFFDIDNIAHLAHVGGLFVGIFMAYLWNRRMSLPKTFLYPIELYEWQTAKNSNDFINIIHTAKEILEYNPYNKEVREFVLDEILKRNLKFIKNKFFIDELGNEIKELMKSKKFENIIHLLERLPLDYRINRAFKNIFHKQLIELLDYSIDRKKLKLSLKIIGVLTEKYSKDSSVSNYLKTAESILKNNQLSASEIYDISVSSKNINFKDKLESFIEF